ncbi:MAG: PKD domain-containing protein [Bacteroidia bacterium]
MKKQVLIGICLLTTGLAFGQSTLQTHQVSIPANLSLRIGSVAPATVTCGNDTVLYPLAKATAASLYTLVGNGGGAFGEGFAQYYEAPQNITIYGVEFFGRGKNNTVSVNVRIYTVNPADSTPAVQLGTVPVSLTVTTASLAAMTRYAVFTTPINVSGPYAVVVEGLAAGNDTFQLATNANGDGAGERLSSVRVLSTAWLNNQDAFGADFDFLAHPIVSYSIASSFITSGTLCEGNPVAFTSTSSPILNSRFYSQAAFYGVTDASYTYNFGDASTPLNQENPAHVYANAGVYNVMLTDSMFAWTVTCTDAATSSTTIDEPPMAAFTLSATTVDVGDTVQFQNTSTGNSTSCLIDFGDGSPVVTSCADTSHQYVVAGTYTVTLTTTNQCGSDSYTQTVTVNTITGVDAAWNENNISVFPNPAQDHITVIIPKGNAVAVAGIYNVAGEIVLQMNLTNPVNEISTANLSAGIYFLKVTDGNHTAVKRIDIVK